MVLSRLNWLLLFFVLVLSGGSLGGLGAVELGLGAIKLHEHGS